MLRAIIIACIVAIATAMSVQEAHDNIRKSFAGQVNAGRGLCQQNTCCNITATETCSISSMAKDQSTLVLPGGNTRCIFSDSSPFAFQVIPGDSDKVLFFFQGGGACWDKLSTTPVPLCTTDSSPAGLNGAFDRVDARNGFKSHTVVHVLYCSGDIYIGDITRDYTDGQGQPVVQSGIANAQSAVDWVLAQQKSGALASSLSELVVMGCSAGSIGAQAWSGTVLKSLKWQKAAVVPDSYAGVFPEGSQGPLIYNYGSCGSSLIKTLSQSVQDKCNAQTLTLQEMDSEMMSQNPTVPFSFVQSKTDIVQQSFYVAVGASTPNTTAAITPTEFYNGVNEIFGTYNKEHSNFLTYLVDGDQHCFTPSSVYYSADPKGANDNGKTSTSPMMHEWAGAFALSEGESSNTVCDNTVSGKAGRDSNTYCADTVVPKTFTEHY